MSARRMMFLRFIPVCVWLFTVVSAARDQGLCKFIPNTSFLNCPCTMSRSPNAEQILRLHNLGQFQDNCTRGTGNELRCQIAREARVEAGVVTLNYTRGFPGTVFCEIYNNTSGGEGSSQRTQVDQLSIPPLVTSANPLSTETDGRRVQDTTTSARMEIVIPVMLVVVVVLIGVPVLILCSRRQCRRRCRRRSVKMEVHSEIPLSAVLIPQAARRSSLPSASDTPEESAPACPITPHD
ncbi:uncharacterized protein [Hemitrygon akajei]|uniref:uncharacterized protein isoform X2 n=1 Tax=Hemitrygon akajei TaxID=2704970 RepID=UPI003BFA057E